MIHFRDVGSYPHKAGSPSNVGGTICSPQNGTGLTDLPKPGWAIFHPAHPPPTSLHFTTLNYISEISRKLSLTLICLFMVMQNNVMKYMTKIGQNTGMLKKSKKVQVKAMIVDLVAEYQNLNSGSRRMKGRNSSFCLVGSSRPSPSSSASKCASAGSIFGVRKANSRFRWYIANAYVTIYQP